MGLLSEGVTPKALKAYCEKDLGSYMESIWKGNESLSVRRILMISLSFFLSLTHTHTHTQSSRRLTAYRFIALALPNPTPHNQYNRYSLPPCHVVTCPIPPPLPSSIRFRSEQFWRLERTYYFSAFPTSTGCRRWWRVRLPPGTSQSISWTGRYVVWYHASVLSNVCFWSSLYLEELKLYFILSVLEIKCYVELFPHHLFSHWYVDASHPLTPLLSVPFLICHLRSNQIGCIQDLAPDIWLEIGCVQGGVSHCGLIVPQNGVPIRPFSRAVATCAL